MSATAISSKGLVIEFFEWFGELGIFCWQGLHIRATHGH